ncbi:DMT family transporter [Clostridium omnivorum]|uniref:Membrane protein n=1 Tax=Clostridium omnivorum TaxID=1604902 RepID=A0ABQ5N4E1_9CLOT|nr:DMT family transporter [Clostridium sp. E14]GLC30071.1 membrane protein [Clostridium sp. E14]
MYSLYSAFVGMLITIMIGLNGTLSNLLGNYISSIIVHFAGLAAVILVLFIKKNKVTFKREIPLYLYSAGAIGVLILLFNNVTFNTIGVSLTVALGLLGQSVASIVIDSYGLFNMKLVRFNKKKILGFMFISIGIIIMTIY